MTAEEIIKKIKSLGNKRNIEGMARFGIRPKTKVFGVSMPELRKISKNIIRQNQDKQKNHNLALKLWDSEIHEARILAGLIADSEKLTETQIEKWVSGFDSWDVVDQVCMNLFDKSVLAKKKISEFATRQPEFEKRTAFALIAALASHDKKMSDKDFVNFFTLIKRASIDERNFVRKAVNWALRGIGKRNKKLNEEAIKFAKEIKKIDSKTAKWIAADAIKELTSEKVLSRLK